MIIIFTIILISSIIVVNLSVIKEFRNLIRLRRFRKITKDKFKPRIPISIERLSKKEDRRILDRYIDFTFEKINTDEEFNRYIINNLQVLILFYYKAADYYKEREEVLNLIIDPFTSGKINKDQLSRTTLVNLIELLKWAKSLLYIMKSGKDSNNRLYQLSYFNCPLITMKRVNKKVYCFSLPEFYKLCNVLNWKTPKDLGINVAVISIVDKYSPNRDCLYSTHPLRMGSLFNVLNLEFADDDKDFYSGTATEIIKFIQDNIHCDFYIHCIAGKSRSQAIGRFILDTFPEFSYGREYDNPLKTPNIHVLTTLKRVYRDICDQPSGNV